MNTKRLLAPLIFLTPIIIAYAIFLIIPIVQTFYYAFSQAGTGSLGLANFRNAYEDRIFWISLQNTILYTVFIVPLVTLIPLGIGLAVNENAKFTGVFKAALFVPVVCSMVTISVIWKFIYHPQVGALNAILGLLHFQPVDLLGSGSTVLYAVAIVAFWSAIGFYMLLFLVGLEAIPQDFYDAAKIDGANKWIRFRYVTLPLLKPTLAFVVTMAFIWNLQTFDPIYVMTGGGPAYSSYTLVYYIYRQAFTYGNLGYATAISVLLFGIVVAVSYLNLRALRSSVEF